MDENLIDLVFEKAGGRDKLQQSLGLSKQSMSDWRRAGYVPARHAVAVEKLTRIPREQLCPDFEWGRKKKAVASDADNGAVA